MSALAMKSGFGLSLLLALASLSPAWAARTVEYVHTDMLGSVVAVTDANRNVIERREYEPYGLQLSPAVKDGPGYTGHVQDAATGLVYMQQRYYDAQLGVFLSVDPVTVSFGTGANFNRYWYASSNPYRFIDPDGRCTGSRIAEEDGTCALTGGPTTQSFDIRSLAPAAGGGARVVAGVGRAVAVAAGGVATVAAGVMYPSELGDGTIPDGQERNNLVQIFRVVGPEEYESIRRYKAYILPPNGLGDKQFWTRIEDAEWFAANEPIMDPSLGLVPRHIVSSLITSRTEAMGYKVWDAGHGFLSFGPAGLMHVNADALHFGGIFTLSTIPPTPGQ